MTRLWEKFLTSDLSFSKSYQSGQKGTKGKFFEAEAAFLILFLLNSWLENNQLFVIAKIIKYLIVKWILTYKIFQSDGRLQMLEQVQNGIKKKYYVYILLVKQYNKNIYSIF